MPLTMGQADKGFWLIHLQWGHEIEFQNTIQLK